MCNDSKFSTYVFFTFSLGFFQMYAYNCQVITLCLFGPDWHERIRRSHDCSQNFSSGRQMLTPPRYSSENYLGSQQVYGGGRWSDLDPVTLRSISEYVLIKAAPSFGMSCIHSARASEGICIPAQIMQPLNRSPWMIAALAYSIRAPLSIITQMYVFSYRCIREGIYPLGEHNRTDILSLCVDIM